MHTVHLLLQGFAVQPESEARVLLRDPPLLRQERPLAQWYDIILITHA